MLRIKEVRNKKNITQDELALKTGLSKRMILDYEKEIKDIPLQKLQLIATALECSIIDLISQQKEYIIDEIVRNVEEPKEKDVIIALQAKIIEELKQDKEDLKNDKALLKSMIEAKMGNQAAS